MRYLFFLLVFFSSFVRAEGFNLDPWTTGDTVRQGIVTALLIVDWSQTHYMATHNCPSAMPNCYVTFREDGNARAFVGSHPSVGQINNYFALAAVGHAAISYMLPRGWRDGWQYVWIGIETQTVRTNYIGMKYGF